MFGIGRKKMGSVMGDGGHPIAVTRHQPKVISGPKEHPFFGQPFLDDFPSRIHLDEFSNPTGVPP